MNTLHIREASIEDMPEVMKLISQSDMSPDNRLTRSQAEALFSKISKANIHKLYVAELGASIIGTFALIVVQQLSHNGAKSVIIEDIVIKTEEQGRGFGKEIMSYATKAAEDLGAYKLVLSSGHARTQAHDFYERLGYQKDGVRFALKLNNKD